MMTLILRVYKHTHNSGRFFYSTSRSASITRTHTSSCVLEICLMIHTPMPTLDCLHSTYFSFTFTGAFPLHTWGVTRNWRTCFASVRRVFLVETVVLQTVLWDIRAWSARFLVFVCFRSRYSYKMELWWLEHIYFNFMKDWIPLEIKMLGVAEKNLIFRLYYFKHVITDFNKIWNKALRAFSPTSEWSKKKKKHYSAHEFDYVEACSCIEINEQLD